MFKPLTSVLSNSLNMFRNDHVCLFLPLSSIGMTFYNSGPRRVFFDDSLTLKTIKGRAPEPLPFESYAFESLLSYDSKRGLMIFLVQNRTTTLKLGPRL